MYSTNPRHASPVAVSSSSSRLRVVVAGAVLLAIALSAGSCGSRYDQLYPETPNPEAYQAYLQARIYREQGAHGPALAAITRAMEHDTTRHPRLPTEAADLLRLSGRPEAAIELLRRVIDDHPDYAHARFVRALAHGELGQLALAIVDLDAALELDPGHAEAAFARARHAIDAGEMDVAMRVLRELASARPGFAHGWLALGNAAYQLEDYQTASTAYEAFLLRDPRSHVVYLKLAHAYKALGQPEKSFELLQDCVDERAAQPCKEAFLQALLARDDLLDLTPHMDAITLAISHGTEALDEALLVKVSLRVLRTQPPHISDAFLENVQHRRPELSDLAVHLGNARAKRGEHKRAIHAYEQVEPASSVYPSALLGRAESALALGDTTEALRIADELVALTPDEPDGYRLQAQALVAAGRHDDAHAALDIAAERGLEHADLAIARGGVFARAGKVDRAFEVFERAMRPPSASPAVVDMLVESGSQTAARLAYLRLAIERQSHLDRAQELLPLLPNGREKQLHGARLALAEHEPGRAVVLLEEATQTYKDDAELLFFLAEAYRSAGGAEVAEQTYRKALSAARTDTLRGAIETALAALSPATQEQPPPPPSPGHGP